MNGESVSPALYTITVALAAGLDEDQAGCFAAILSDHAISTSLLRERNGDWEVQWLVEGEADRAEILSRLSLQESLMGIPGSVTSCPVIEAVPPDINWLERSYRQLPPFTVGPFYLYGSHTTGSVPAGLIPLQIDATTAFGSGEHGTTSGCMMLMDGLKQDGFHPRNVLDMGCGSGILGIAAHRLWGCPVLAVDIDSEAARVTRHHCDINGIGNDVIAVAGDGFAAPAVDEGKPFDLIIANILPQPLKEMAPAVGGTLAPAGRIILSGILTPQGEGVMEAYRRQGFVLRRHIERGEWSAFLLEKP